jgi:hypothetical protein
MFLIKSDLNRGGGLSPFIYNFALQYVISLVQANLKGLELNGKHQLLFTLMLLIFVVETFSLYWKSKEFRWSLERRLV